MTDLIQIVGNLMYQSALCDENFGESISIVNVPTPLVFRFETMFVL